MALFSVRAERAVPLEDLDLIEVTVLPEYFFDVDDEIAALEEFYWHAPINDHKRFAVRVGRAV